MSNNFIYQCTNCGQQYDNSEVRYLCPECESTNTPGLPPKGILKTAYDYEKLKSENTGFEQLQAESFISLLPLNSLNSLPNLKIGDTPLYSVDNLNQSPLPFQLFLKDDSQNPTYSFKDRASSVVSAFAKEHDMDTIITASTGNAGSSLAGICASQRQKAIILLPEDAPLGKLAQALMYGARVIRVKGNYDDAFDLSIEATKQFGYYNRNTAFNPATIEGKKTVSFELFKQLDFNLPDKIFVPVGDGVIISGVYKGFEDLLRLGIIKKIPVVVAVQAEGSDNLIRNINPGTGGFIRPEINKSLKGGFIRPNKTDTLQNFIIKPSRTIADSISVDVPRNFFMTQKYIQEYDGRVQPVSDDDILKASKLLAQNTGLFAEPAAAAAFAGFLTHYHNGKIAKKSNNVVLLTGSGLKDLDAIQPVLNIPDAINPDLNQLKNALS